MKFKKLHVLGRGSYGTVYLIQDEKTNKKYALKKIPYKKDYIKSCDNELKILKIVKSDYIVGIVEYFIKNNYLNIIMEYAPYGDLRQYMEKYKNKMISDRTLKKITISVIKGLKELNKFGIIHRDIKPSNILICDNYKIKLTDFGISKIIKNKYAAYTKIGTPYYMSPEMISGYGYSYPVDYWSLGCIIYELLTKKKPFNGTSIYSLYSKIKVGYYSKVEIPRKYLELVNGLLNKDPNKRFNYNNIINYFRKNYKSVERLPKVKNVYKVKSERNSFAKLPKLENINNEENKNNIKKSVNLFPKVKNNYNYYMNKINNRYNIRFNKKNRYIIKKPFY